METLFIYLLLKVTMLCSGFLCGYKCYQKKKFLPYILMFILFFSINEGLRFGRGVDYNGYYFKYADILQFGFQEAKEFLFIAYCKLINILGLDYQGFIFSLSFILVCSCVYSLRGLKPILPFALPLFCFYSLGAENLIRWWLSFSFLMIAVSFVVEKKWKYVLLFCVIAALFHNAMLIVIAIMGSLYFIKPYIKVLYLWIMYLLVYLFFKPEYIETVSQYLSLLQMGDSFQFAGYIQNSSAWLTGTANYVAGQLSLMLVLQDLLVLYVAKFVVVNHPNLGFYYNLCLFGTLLYPAFYQVEILWRIIDVFHLYQYLFLAVALTDIVFFKSKYIYGHKVFIASIFVVFNLIRMHIINFLFDYDENAILFIWDAAGRHYLDVI